MFNDVIKVIEAEIKKHIQHNHLSDEQYKRFVDSLIMLKKNELEVIKQMSAQLGEKEGPKKIRVL